MPELHLRLRPGHRRRPLEYRRVAVLVGEVERRLARRRHQGREGDAHGRARGEAHRAPQAEDRVEHRADRVRQGVAVDHRHRGPHPAPAAEEAQAVGLVLPVARAAGAAI